eukprot:CAMPEP_0196573630 /NCGR_PEP_ID=MMETSP1081-20130531/3503_1 /TAXON_ID=36882 /ORGANISM="Pyramimonas amylifera, Strain CCMP720" /LENGTH=116 /DNA_ID=CAMNT_0041891409 /DNA_START=164 /DNA_END=514 /DNA_ORIENTATION=+
MTRPNQGSHVPGQAPPAGREGSNCEASPQLVPWNSKTPLTVKDLGQVAGNLSGRQLARLLHRTALEVGAETYTDPTTGYSVFTEIFLRGRPCCGNKCRHCPYGHVNVPNTNAGLDW